MESPAPALSIIVPAYKEELTIEEAISRLISVLDSIDTTYEIVVVVDGNFDGTAAIVSQLKSKNIKLIEYPLNRGKGYAIRRGIEASSAYEYIGFIDADLDLHPESLIEATVVLGQSEEYVGVVGSKSHKESRVNYPSIRRFQSLMFQLLVRALFHLGINDTQTGLKVFRAKQLRGVQSSLKSDGFAIDLEILVQLKAQKGHFKEIPVNLDYQFSSTVRLGNAISSVRDVIKIRRNLHAKRQRS